MSWFILRLALVIAGLGAAQVLMMRYFNRPVWDTKWGRRLSLGWPLATVVSILLWSWSFRLGPDHWLPVLLLLVSASFLVGLVAAFISLPLAGLLNLFEYFRQRFRASRTPEAATKAITIAVTDAVTNVATIASVDCPASVSRRSFLQKTAAALPAIAVGGSILGVGKSFDDVRVFERELHFKNLPQELDGFRILHLCDLHIGAYFNLPDLEKLIDQLAGERYDLVTLIGDVSDDLDVLPDALEMVASLSSTHGHLATLGNHEYYRGIQAVYHSYKNSKVHLLVNEGINLTVGESSIFVGGADDPALMSWGVDRTEFFKNSVNGAMKDSTSSAFKLLLTHRPSAFKVAEAAKIDLSLAGHTHGGQLGLMRQSVIDMFADDLYVWGHFTRGESQLYTSSGVGHWFPFRLGCPAEAPIFTLRRA